ncbi:MAG: transposase [Thermoleophilia bacterium]
MTSTAQEGRRPLSFSAQYKAEVVGLCMSGERSIAQVARDLDLTTSAVRRWVAEGGDRRRSQRGPHEQRARRTRPFAPREPRPA